MKRILFTGGGSAGHVTPNIALIEAFLQSGEADVCYMGTSGIEKTMITALKIPYYTLECPKLIRSFSWKNFGIPHAFQKAVKEAKKGLTIAAPDVVFSKGGFVALPVAIAAEKLGIPVLTHESDLSAGLSNKLMARRCKHVLTSFPETAEKFKNGKFVGSPIRQNIFLGDRAEAAKKYGFDLKNGRKRILVFGGGSGSQFLNEAVRKCLPTLSKEYDILHVTGRGNVREARFEGYRQIEFETDMGGAYAVCDLVISRAGSNTVFEILALKKRVILIPLEGQTRGDQLENAYYFAKQGLCKVLRQSELDALPQTIEATFKDEALKERLCTCSFTSGNETILGELFSGLEK